MVKELGVNTIREIKGINLGDVKRINLGDVKRIKKINYHESFSKQIRKSHVNTSSEMEMGRIQRLLWDVGENMLALAPGMS